MDRIDPQQFLYKKTNKAQAIAAICEHTASPIRQVQVHCDHTLDATSNGGAPSVTPASHWLSSAMAIWLQHDQDQDTSQTRGMR